MLKSATKIIMCEILKLYEHISINTNLIQVSEPRTFFSELEKLFLPQTKQYM